MIKEVECYCTDCISWRKSCNCTDTAHIVISENGCENWLSYREHKDYQNVYWIACNDKETGKKVRKALKGKRIEIDGFIFYTGDNTEEGYCECQFTEEKTGMAVPGGLAFTPDGQLLDKAKERIREEMAKAQPVMELPIWDGEQE